MSLISRTWRAAGRTIALALAIGLGLTGCAEQGVTRAMNGSQSFLAQQDYFPGGFWMYSWGIGQSKESFENVERAQDSYGRGSNRRTWSETGPGGRPSATMGALQSYLPLSVRWKLKDGRELMLENIDVRSIMREYFKTHDIKLQWQRENRPRDRVGDFEPMLSYEVRGDAVVIKWVITINRTPPARRLTPTGAATRWDTYDEQSEVISLQGKPTSGIDFNKRFEFFK
jgi:hypothetical protein